MPESMLKVVVLPAPLWPSRQKSWSFLTPKLILKTAVNAALPHLPPKRLHRLITRTASSSPSPPPAPAGSSTWKLCPSVTPSGTVKSKEAPSCMICTASPAALPGGHVVVTLTVLPGAATRPRTRFCSRSTWGEGEGEGWGLG